MSKALARYITLNDSRVVAKAALHFGQEVIGFSDFDFSNYSAEQRKVVFGWFRGEGAKYGPAVKSTILSVKRVPLTLLSGCKQVSIILDGRRIVLDRDTLPAGTYNVDVTVYLDRPLEAFGDVSDHIKPLLQYSEIVNVVAVLSLAGEDFRVLPRYAGPVYDGADRLGFFLADVQKMDDFIKENSDYPIVDLQKEFCETEIANYLFEAGLLILVWGMTPWHYYIYGLSSASDVKLVPGANTPQFNGKYKIRSDIKKLSVIPGEQLLNWPSCVEQEWPKIDLVGDGEAVDVNVHLRSFDPIHGEFGPSLAVITVHRTESDPVVAPLLAVDIESVMVDPGY